MGLLVFFFGLDWLGVEYTLTSGCLLLSFAFLNLHVKST
jgi:hypothetical protein